MNNWVLVANRSSAKIFNVKKPVKILEAVTIIENESGRLKESDLISDQAGAGMNSAAGKGSVYVGKENKATNHATEIFAQDIAKYIKNGLNQNAFNDLIVVAEPGLFGVLKDKFDKNKIKITKKIGKDLKDSSDKQLLDYLKDDLTAIFPPG